MEMGPGARYLEDDAWPARQAQACQEDETWRASRGFLQGLAQALQALPSTRAGCYRAVPGTHWIAAHQNSPDLDDSNFDVCSNKLSYVVIPRFQNRRTVKSRSKTVT